MIPPSTAAENHAWLVGRFAARLLAERPAGVCDLGCGAGRLLRLLREAGLPALGVERDEDGLAPLREDGLEVRAADLQALPFAAQSQAWVAMRHVPHHLADPARGLREAWRVARDGLLVAEPWRDPSVPSQRTSLAADLWLKRQHRRAGRIHGDDLDAGALLAPLPPAEVASVEVSVDLRLRGRDREDWLAEATPWLEALPPGDPDREVHAELLAAIDRDGLSWNGSLSLTIRRR
ncbi:MAG: class I SAM-dependent methyltransferase [Planctomycetota bacterium]